MQGTVRCHKRYRVTIGSLPTRSSQSRGRQHSTQLAAATPAGEARARSETPSAVGVTEYHRAASVQGTRLRAGPLRRRAVGHYPGNHLIEVAAYSSRDSVHYHLGGTHGNWKKDGVQANMFLATV